VVGDADIETGGDDCIARLEARIAAVDDGARKVDAANAGKRRMILPAPVAARASL
jgi:hypothetical protein